LKRFYIALVFIILLSGCATYKTQKISSSSDGGFVVSRYGKVIREYTVGSGNSLPDKKVAEERFKRRRPEVEYYYKQMGFINNRFKHIFVEPPLTLIQLVVGIFRMPFIAVSDYKYNHNPQYKAKMDKLEDLEYNAQRARVEGFKEKLNEYIKEDLSKESPPAAPAIAEPEVKPSLAQVEPEVKPVSTPVEPEAETAVTLVEPEVKLAEITKPEVQEKTMVIQEDLKSTPAIEEPKPQEIKPQLSLPNPTAVIIARPQNGESPLKVNFSGKKSLSPNGRIISYSWDFGDGDKSNKPNPSNTYWSTTYGTREFIATLIVTDNKGMVSSSTITIQVINK
jgi:hypothetical protein